MKYQGQTYTYQALYEPNLPRGAQYLGTVILVDGHQVGGNQGGHYTCGHAHRTDEAAHRCGKRLGRAGVGYTGPV